MSDRSHSIHTGLNNSSDAFYFLPSGLVGDLRDANSHAEDAPSSLPSPSFSLSAETVPSHAPPSWLPSQGAFRASGPSAVDNGPFGFSPWADWNSGGPSSPMARGDLASSSLRSPGHGFPSHASSSLEATPSGPSRSHDRLGAHSPEESFLPPGISAERMKGQAAYNAHFYKPTMPFSSEPVGPSYRGSYGRHGDHGAPSSGPYAHTSSSEAFPSSYDTPNSFATEDRNVSFAAHSAWASAHDDIPVRNHPFALRLRQDVAPASAPLAAAYDRPLQPFFPTHDAPDSAPLTRTSPAGTSAPTPEAAPPAASDAPKEKSSRSRRRKASKKQREKKKRDKERREQDVDEGDSHGAALSSSPPPPPASSSSSPSEPASATYIVNKWGRRELASPSRALSFQKREGPAPSLSRLGWQPKKRSASPAPSAPPSRPSSSLASTKNSSPSPQASSEGTQEDRKTEMNAVLSLLEEDGGSASRGLDAMRPPPSSSSSPPIEETTEEEEEPVQPLASVASVATEEQTPVEETTSLLDDDPKEEEEKESGHASQAMEKERKEEESSLVVEAGEGEGQREKDHAEDAHDERGKETSPEPSGVKPTASAEKNQLRSKEENANSHDSSPRRHEEAPPEATPLSPSQDNHPITPTLTLKETERDDESPSPPREKEEEKEEEAASKETTTRSSTHQSQEDTPTVETPVERGTSVLGAGMWKVGAFCSGLFLHMHRAAWQVLGRRHVAFTIAYIYAFPFLVTALTDETTSAASIIWYSFLVWFFVHKGTLLPPAAPSSSASSSSSSVSDGGEGGPTLNVRLLLPLLFVFEAVCNPRFIVLWNGGERLVLAFVLLSMKANHFFHWSCFAWLGVLIVASVVVGSHLLVQWAILVMALSSLSPSFSWMEHPLLLVEGGRKEHGASFSAHAALSSSPSSSLYEGAWEEEEDEEEEDDEEDTLSSLNSYNPSFEVNLLPSASTSVHFYHKTASSTTSSSSSSRRRFKNRR